MDTLLEAVARALNSPTITSDVGTADKNDAMHTIIFTVVAVATILVGHATGVAQFLTSAGVPQTIVDLLLMVAAYVVKRGASGPTPAPTIAYIPTPSTPVETPSTTVYSSSAEGSNPQQ